MLGVAGFERYGESVSGEWDSSPRSRASQCLLFSSMRATEALAETRTAMATARPIEKETAGSGLVQAEHAGGVSCRQGLGEEHGYVPHGSGSRSTLRESSLSDRSVTVASRCRLVIRLAGPRGQSVPCAQAGQAN